MEIMCGEGVLGSEMQPEMPKELLRLEKNELSRSCLEANAYRAAQVAELVAKQMRLEYHGFHDSRAYCRPEDGLKRRFMGPFRSLSKPSMASKGRRTQGLDFSAPGLAAAPGSYGRPARSAPGGHLRCGPAKGHGGQVASTPRAAALQEPVPTRRWCHEGHVFTIYITFW